MARQTYSPDPKSSNDVMPMQKAISIIARAILVILLVGGCFLERPQPGICRTFDPEVIHGAGIENTKSPVLQNGEKRDGWITQIQQAAETFLARINININLDFLKYYVTWIVGAPTLVIVIVIAMIFRPSRKKSPPSVSAAQTNSLSPSRTASNPPIFKTRMEPDPATDKERVLHFFMQLFRQQINALPDSETELKLVETRPICPNETYEMRIWHGNDWASRRMSIGLLGQGGGSRSKCFYVIYDAHIVLKLPSEPIQAFVDYREKIQAEAAIVARLAPRQCIVPRIGVILKAVYNIAQSETLSEEALEERYVRAIEDHPELQEYLKIGPSFAFFMDLTRHFFLSSTLDEMHRGNQRIVHETMKQHELLWDQNAFICRYGEEAESICHELQDAYYRCEGRLRQLVDEAGIVKDIPTFQLKQWFLSHLAGEKIYAVGDDIPEKLIDQINHLLTQVMRSSHYQVERYRQGVRNYIKEMRFSQHRIQLENLSGNTLDLLAWIGQKGLALRDLKPENLFVAGKSEEYPIFLNDVRKFSIGLIDVETAVVLTGGEAYNLPQPQMAGTPLYATPSHLLSNIILQEVYSDVGLILHLQDWFATMAIIFKVISGHNLFAVTARTFPEIVRRIRLIDPTGPDVDRDVADINALFWNSAIAEFQEGLRQHIDILNRVEVTVPKPLIADIIKALHRESDQIIHRLKQIINRQSVFTGRDKRQFLMDAPVEKIHKMSRKLSAEKTGSLNRARQRQQAMDVLNKIEPLKYRLQRKYEAAAALKATADHIGADQLLEAMFEKVFNAMYLPHWPAPAPAQWYGKVNLPNDLATYQATL